MPAKLRLIPEKTADRGNASEAPEDVEQLQLELELAQERLAMRRALAAKLVEEYATRPMQIPARALRTALVERDLTEEECERLRITLAKLQSGKTISGGDNDR